VAGCCECGDEPSGSGATELVSMGPQFGGMYMPKGILTSVLSGIIVVPVVHKLYYSY
jgi:hypothetical protein